jgi:hypothetical protein
MQLPSMLAVEFLLQALNALPPHINPFINAFSTTVAPTGLVCVCHSGRTHPQSLYPSSHTHSQHTAHDPQTPHLDSPKSAQPPSHTPQTSRHIRESARLPRVVGRLRGDDDLRALGEHQPSCVGHTSRESLHHDARGGRACLGPGAGTVRAAVVGWVWAAAVVVAEFEEDKVAWGEPGVTEAAMAAMAAKWPLTVYERAERPAIASLMTGILRE